MIRGLNGASLQAMASFSMAVLKSPRCASTTPSLLSLRTPDVAEANTPVPASVRPAASTGHSIWH